MNAINTTINSVKMFDMVGKPIVRLPVVDSTNNYANTQLRENILQDGTVFLAYEQFGGRGQMKNYWESEPGKNLTFSIVLFPDFLDIRSQFMLSKVVTLGIYSALNKYIDSLSIKWPNDIYAGKNKLGGILIENSIMYSSIKSSVVGVGVNVNQTEFLSEAPNPVSLKILTNTQYDGDSLLMEILEGIDIYYSLLKENQQEQINQQFISLLYRLNETHSFQDTEEKFEGTIVGVNNIGQLLVRKQGGKIMSYHFKEVEFLPDEKD